MHTLAVKPEVAPLPDDDLVYLRQWSPKGEALRVVAVVSFDQARELVESLRDVIATYDTPRRVPQ